MLLLLFSWFFRGVGDGYKLLLPDERKETMQILRRTEMELLMVPGCGFTSLGAPFSVQNIPVKEPVYLLKALVKLLTAHYKYRSYTLMIGVLGHDSAL